MRELIPAIEEALGPQRLAVLTRNEDEYQDFWVGVLEALSRVDWDRDVMSYLITAGYGAIRNGRRSEWTVQRFRSCLVCGKIYGYRMTICPECGGETESEIRCSEMKLEPPARERRDADLAMTLEQFVDTKVDKERYIARRWLLDRADLRYQNYQKQIAYEIKLSAPRVAQIVTKLKREFQLFLNR